MGTLEALLGVAEDLPLSFVVEDIVEVSGRTHNLNSFHWTGSVEERRKRGRQPTDMDATFRVAKQTVLVGRVFW